MHGTDATLATSVMLPFFGIEGELGDIAGTLVEHVDELVVTESARCSGAVRPGRGVRRGGLVRCGLACLQRRSGIAARDWRRAWARRRTCSYGMARMA